MKTEKQIEKDVFSIVKAAMSDLISGNVYRNNMRPTDARGEDIVVSFFTGINLQVQSGIVFVTAYVPDKPQKGYSKKIENSPRIGELQSQILDLFENVENPEYEFAIEDQPTTDFVEGIEEHFVVFRVNFRRITFND